MASRRNIKSERTQYVRDEQQNSQLSLFFPKRGDRKARKDWQQNIKHDAMWNKHYSESYKEITPLDQLVVQYFNDFWINLRNKRKSEYLSIPEK